MIRRGNCGAAPAGRTSPTTTTATSTTSGPAPPPDWPLALPGPAAAAGAVGGGGRQRAPVGRDAQGVRRRARARQPARPVCAQPLLPRAVHRRLRRLAAHRAAAARRQGRRSAQRRAQLLQRPGEPELGQRGAAAGAGGPPAAGRTAGRLLQYLQRKHLATHPVEVFHMADKYCCSSLVTAARSALLLQSPCEHLLPQLHQFTADKVVDLLAADDLQAPELEVHAAVCRWWRVHASDNPGRLLVMLNTTVRYKYMAEQEWQQLLASEEVQANPKLLLYLAEQQCAIAGALTSQPWLSEQLPRTQCVEDGGAMLCQFPFEYAHGEKLLSGLFRVSGLPQTWQLVVYPKGRDSSDYVSLMLHCSDLGNQTEVEVQCELGFVHPEDEARDITASRFTRKFTKAGIAVGMSNGRGLLRQKLFSDGFMTERGTVTAFVKVSAVKS